MPKAERVIGGGADGESGAARGPASESRQAASAGSMSRLSSAAWMTSWTAHGRERCCRVDALAQRVILG